MECPLCQADLSRKVFDGSFYTLNLCLNCHSNFQARYGEPVITYEEDYFKTGHLKTYGKTYIDDEWNIREIAQRRLRILVKMLPPGGRILDIGSAMGLFCDEAVKMGLRSEGVEISDYARDFSNQAFKLKVWQDPSEISGNFDAVSLWFTLEHMQEPLSWIKKACSFLNERGIIALSVPNSVGAFPRFNPTEYYLKRPEEHYFEPSPGAMISVLKTNGFHLERLEFFGLHPERAGLPSIGIIKIIQKLTGLGDTFEIYARKLY
jgi:cyclopropane fatty-acyl-phospholipid synthase-like methyltransferase